MNHKIIMPRAAASIPRRYKSEMDSVRDLLNNGIPKENDSEAESGESEAIR